MRGYTCQLAILGARNGVSVLGITLRFEARSARINIFTGILPVQEMFSSAGLGKILKSAGT